MKVRTIIGNELRLFWAKAFINIAEEGTTFNVFSNYLVWAKIRFFTFRNKILNIKIRKLYICFYKYKIFERKCDCKKVINIDLFCKNNPN